MSKRSFARAVAAALATCTLAATPAFAESTGEGAEETNAAVLSPLAFAPLAQPDPVLGSDDKVHLAYEMQVMNASRASVSMTSIDTLDAKDDAVLGTMDADTLPGMLNLSGGVQGTTLPESGAPTAQNSSSVVCRYSHCSPYWRVSRAASHAASTSRPSGDQIRSVFHSTAGVSESCARTSS